MEEKMLSSKDGKCPYCGSPKVGPAGGFVARASSSSKLPKPIPNWYCDNCMKIFLPPKK